MYVPLIQKFNPGLSDAIASSNRTWQRMKYVYTFSTVKLASIIVLLLRCSVYYIAYLRLSGQFRLVFLSLWPASVPSPTFLTLFFLSLSRRRFVLFGFRPLGFGENRRLYLFCGIFCVTIIDFFFFFFVVVVFVVFFHIKIFFILFFAYLWLRDSKYLGIQSFVFVFLRWRPRFSWQDFLKGLFELERGDYFGCDRRVRVLRAIKQCFIGNYAR